MYFTSQSTKAIRIIFLCMLLILITVSLYVFVAVGQDANSPAVTQSSLSTCIKNCVCDDCSDGQNLFYTDWLPQNCLDLYTQAPANTVIQSPMKFCTGTAYIYDSAHDNIYYSCDSYCTSSTNYPGYSGECAISICRKKADSAFNRDMYCLMPEYAGTHPVYKRDPVNKYEKECYAEYNYRNWIIPITPSDAAEPNINLVLKHLYGNAVAYGPHQQIAQSSSTAQKKELTKFFTAAYNFWEKILLSDTRSFLRYADSETLSILSQVIQAPGAASTGIVFAYAGIDETPTTKTEFDLLSSLLNSYIGNKGMQKPFSPEFYCPYPGQQNQNTNVCTIYEAENTLNLQLNGVVLPLDQLNAYKDSLLISYDSAENKNMLKLQASAEMPIETGPSIYCSSSYDKNVNSYLTNPREKIILSLKENAFFECGTTSSNEVKAILTPGAKIWYNGIVFQKEGNGILEIIWGSSPESYTGSAPAIYVQSKEGMYTLSFIGEIKDVIVRKGCLVGIINPKEDGTSCWDKGYPRYECADPGKYGEAFGEPFMFSCGSEGKTGFANEHCWRYDKSLDESSDDSNTLCEYSSQEIIGTKPANDKCPSCYPTGKEFMCDSATDIDIEDEDKTFADLKKNCEACPADENQKLCDAALLQYAYDNGYGIEDIKKNTQLLKEADVKTWVDSILDDCQAKKSVCIPEYGSTIPGIGLAANAISKIGDASALNGCKTVGIGGEYCDTEAAYVSGSSVTLTCRIDGGATAFVTYDKTGCSSHNKGMNFPPSSPPFSIMGSVVCDEAGKTVTVPVTPNTPFEFGVFGGTPCSAELQGRGSIAAAPDGKCRIEDDPISITCLSQAGQGENENLWKKLCTLPDSDGLDAMGNGLEFNGELFISTRRQGMTQRVYRLNPRASCFEDDGSLDKAEAVAKFVSFNGKLYVGMENPKKVFRQESPGNWDEVLAFDNEEGAAFAGAAMGNTLYWASDRGGKEAEIWKTTTGNKADWQKIYTTSEYTLYDAAYFNNAIYFAGFTEEASAEESNKKGIVLKWDGSKISKIIDLDAPGKRIFGWTMAVKGDDLYVGTISPGMVYKIGKNDEAKEVFTSSYTDAVRSIAASSQKLFAGVSSNVFMSDNGDEWVNDIQFQGSTIKAIGVFNGNAYAFPTTDEGIDAWVRSGAGGNLIIPSNQSGNATINVTICIDNDKDDYCSNSIQDNDCNDNNAKIHPKAPETCSDNIDQDCDNYDLKCPSTCGSYVDYDKDAYCSDKDCNDNNASIHPLAQETCGDGIDQNCNPADDSCPVCTQNEDILCIGKTPQGTEDATCIYHKTCNPLGQFSSCTKLDNSCEEHSSCLPGQILSCPRQFGVCAGSKQSCDSSGKWPGCDYLKIPGYSQTEICNDGLDNNCDGSIDESCACYGSPDIVCGSIIGECAKSPVGKQSCKDSKWTSCQNNRQPKPEILDNKDNDCDGSIDEWLSCGYLNETSSKSCSINSCSTNGKQYCQRNINNTSSLTECINSIVPSFESCQDEKDNDCDGSIDENCPCSNEDTRVCGPAEIGICTPGKQECINGKLSLCDHYVMPEQEKCSDNLDNDCDGSIDEGCPCLDNVTGQNITTANCILQKGVCENSTSSCINGKLGNCSYELIPDYEIKETKCSDSLDNDCDGSVDSADSDCKLSEEKCIDGTLNNKCSSEKPLYCSNKILESRCKKCGCPSGKSCTSSGSCELSTCGNNYCDSDDEKTLCPKDCPEEIEEPKPLDSDGDGLADYEESQRGTDPNSQDTDLDGIKDSIDTSPLCNSNGECDEKLMYSETELNCPKDCQKASYSKYIMMGIILFALVLLASYLLYKRKKQFPKKIPVSVPMTQIKKDLSEHKNTEQLESYVKAALERGINESKIKSDCLVMGWSQSEIIAAIGKAKTRISADKYGDLRNYIRSAIEKNIKESEIRQKLVNAGWKKEIIDSILAELKR